MDKRTTKCLLQIIEEGPSSDLRLTYYKKTYEKGQFIKAQKRFSNLPDDELNSLFGVGKYDAGGSCESDLWLPFFAY